MINETIEIPFEGIDPNVIIQNLQKIDIKDCLNGKQFWKTYGKWELLSLDQRNKAIVFWKSNINEAKRQEVLNVARSQLAEEVLEDNNRQAITNKHDKARLIHLRVDPSAQGDWTSALREKSRAEIDNNSADANPWNRLAEKFNDYNRYSYKNACIIPNALDSIGCYKPVIGMESIATLCHDINPSMSGRPIRNADWLKTQYKELKTKLTVIYNNYHRSGNQDAENVYDEWVRFSTQLSNDVLTYARAILDNTVLDNLGKALPNEVQMDTGALKTSNYEEIRQAKAESRKKSRIENQLKKINSSNTSSLSSNNTKAFSDQIIEMNNTLKEHVKIESSSAEFNKKVSKMKLILEYGSSQQKQTILNKLMKESNDQDYDIDGSIDDSD